jgi:hypothetical protein
MRASTVGDLDLEIGQPVLQLGLLIRNRRHLPEQPLVIRAPGLVFVERLAELAELEVERAKPLPQ